MMRAVAVPWGLLPAAVAAVLAGCPELVVKSFSDCLTVSCSGADCDDKVKPDFCYIDDQCFASGQTMPGDLCHWCEPAKSQTVAVGVCATGQHCTVEGVCLGADADVETDSGQQPDAGPDGDAGPDVDAAPDACVPDCDGKACGPDGCGGACGTCGPGTTCHPSTLSCIATCTPDCVGKTCGPDGCGGVCGACTGQDACVDGHCACQPACTSSCAGLCPAGSEGCSQRVCAPFGEDGCGAACDKCQCAVGDNCDACDTAADCMAGYACLGWDAYRGAQKWCTAPCAGDGDCPATMTCDFAASHCVPSVHSVCTPGNPMTKQTQDACGNLLQTETCAHACDNGDCVETCGWLQAGCAVKGSLVTCCQPGAPDTTAGRCCRTCWDNTFNGEYQECCDAPGSCDTP